ncbi:hypothetical protein MTO96_020306 [Rhipicephalus appendiculatus]
MRSLVAGRTTKTALDEMWSHRVYHYGQVNTPSDLAGLNTVQYITQSAKGLQTISQLMKGIADSEHQPSYTILHYPLMYESMAAEVASALTAHPVDLFVAIGYTAYSDYGKKDCRMVPPILHSTQLLEPALLNGTYPIRLVRVISALKNLKREWKNTTALAVSLVKHDFVLFRQGCKDPRYNETFSFDSTFEALFAYDKSDQMLFTYDSAFSFRLKLCDTKKNVSDLHYNVVADDIQYDDIDNLCGYGEYSRLHTLNRLAAFLRINYTSPDQGTTCKLVT